VGTEVLVRKYCLHLLTDYEDRHRKMLLQNIHNHVPNYMVSKPRPHYKSSPLWAPQILYLRILRTSEVWMQMSCSENWTTEEQYVFMDTGFNIPYFPHPLCTQFFIFSLSNKLRKWDLKYWLVTDTVSINTQFRVRNTYDAFQSSPNNDITRTISHIQNYLQCWTFWMDK